MEKQEQKRSYWHLKDASHEAWVASKAGKHVREYVKNKVYNVGARDSRKHMGYESTQGTKRVRL